MDRLARIAFAILSALLIPSLPGTRAYASELKVRVINAKDGQAAQDLPVEVYAYDQKPGKPLKAVTGADGVASFSLPDPAPRKVLVIDDVSGKVAGCSSAEFSTLDVLETGVVGDTKFARCDPKGKLRGRFTAHPGEIVVFIRFLRWLERMQT